MLIFVINSGSSSLKYQLFDMEKDLSSHKVLAKGHIDGINLHGCKYIYEINGNKYEERIAITTHNEALKLALKTIKTNEICEPIKDIKIIGHRVVHGGDYYKAPALVDNSAISYLRIFSELAPLHNPHNISGITACKKYLPDAKQFAVFDTAFHQSLPEKAFMYGLPLKYFTQDKVRKYGFHGTSHRYLATEAIRLMKNKKNAKVITCHLGNGSSIAASLDGVCQDTSMGFTPIDGVLMGTRSGSIDPGALLYLMKKHKISAIKADKILNKESGFLGLTGMSTDLRDIYNLSKKKNKKAVLALEKVQYDIMKTVGSYIAVLNGVDAIVFSGGIGENAFYLRKAVCEHLEYLGVKLDGRKNLSSSEVISAPSSKVKVFVIKADEELEIARQVMDKAKRL